MSNKHKSHKMKTKKIKMPVSFKKMVQIANSGDKEAENKMRDDFYRANPYYITEDGYDFVTHTNAEQRETRRYILKKLLKILTQMKKNNNPALQEKYIKLKEKYGWMFN